MKRQYQLCFTLVLSAAVVATSSACHRRVATDDETPDTSTYRPESTPATQYERDLKYIRDGHFVNVWVFSRKDGKPFTSDDSQVLRTNAPHVVDWVTTDEKKKVIAGSNFPIEPTQMAELQKRFNVELLPPQP